MSEVYRARDPRLGCDVAIKVVPAAFAVADGERVDRFEHEARATAALNQSNMFAVYDLAGIRTATANLKWYENVGWC